MSTRSQRLGKKRDHLLQQAEAITCSDDQTAWQDLHRQKRITPSVDVSDRPPHRTSPLSPLIHIGKNAVKGNGWYTIETSH